MSRAAILPTTGDPFNVSAWISSYKKCVQKHVDKLYVCVNSPVEDRVFNYVLDLFKDIDAEITTDRRMTDHGPAITKLVNMVKEDHVLILEDDFYIQDANCVDQWFKIVESGQSDMVGSMRGSCSPELCAAVAKKYGITGKEKHQTSFWPCLFISKVSDLKRTDMNFAGKRYSAGVHIPEANATPPKDWAGDTFVWASVQLRALGLSVHQIPQYRIIDVQRLKLMPPPWVHAGSNSASLNGHLLRDDMTIIGSTQPITRGFPKVPDPGIKEHYERTFARWAVLNKHFPIPASSDAAYFNKEYADAIQRTVTGCNLTQNKFLGYQKEFENMIRPTL